MQNCRVMRGGKYLALCPQPPWMLIREFRRKIGLEICIGWARTGIVERESRKPRLQPSPLCSLWRQALNFSRKRTVQCRHEANNTLYLWMRDRKHVEDRTSGAQHNHHKGHVVSMNWNRSAHLQQRLSHNCNDLSALTLPFCSTGLVSDLRQLTDRHGWKKGKWGRVFLRKTNRTAATTKHQRGETLGKATLRGKKILWNIVPLIMPKTAIEKCQEETANKARWEIN